MNALHIVIAQDVARVPRGLDTLLRGIPRASVRAFSAASDALATARRCNADLFVIDYRVAPRVGLHVLAALRGHAEFDGMPVVFVTDCRTPDLRVDALRCGATDALPSTLDPCEFIARVESLLGRASRL